MIHPSSPTSRSIDPGMRVDLTLRLAALHAQVQHVNAAPALILSAGNAVVRITAGDGGPAVAELILLGRLVAAALRFQAVCGRFTRRRNGTAPAPVPPSPEPPTCLPSPSAVSGK